MFIFSPLFIASMVIGLYGLALSIIYVIRKIYFLTTGTIGYIAFLFGASFFYDNNLYSGIPLMAIGGSILFLSKYPKKISGQYRRWWYLVARTKLRDRMIGRIPKIELEASIWINSVI